MKNKTKSIKLDDSLAKTANLLSKYLIAKGFKVNARRMKSIHGPDDDIIEIDLGFKRGIRLFASDTQGRFDLEGIGFHEHISEGKIKKDDWQDDLSKINIDIFN